MRLVPPALVTLLLAACLGVTEQAGDPVADCPQGFGGQEGEPCGGGETDVTVDSDGDDTEVAGDTGATDTAVPTDTDTDVVVDTGVADTGTTDSGVVDSDTDRGDTDRGDTDPGDTDPGDTDPPAP